MFIQTRYNNNFKRTESMFLIGKTEIATAQRINRSETGVLNALNNIFRAHKMEFKHHEKSKKCTTNKL